MYDSDEIVALLLPRFPDVDVRTTQGRDPVTGEPRECFGETALMLACGRGRHSSVTLLLIAGASRTARNNMHVSPLLCGAAAKSLACLRLLLGAHGDYEMRAEEINAADVDDRTALHKAAASGDLQCCALLMEAGASLAAVTLHRKTPLRVAQRLHPGNAELHSLLDGSVPPSQRGAVCDHCGVAASDAPEGLDVCVCERKMYCGRRCQRRAWAAHEEECERWRAEAEAGKVPTILGRDAQGNWRQRAVSL